VDAGILPVKSPARAKARLGAGLSDVARRSIVAALIEDAFELCRATPFLRWWVVSDDAQVRQRAGKLGLQTIADGGEGLNEALGIAIEAVTLAGARSALILSADIPLASPEDLRDLIDTGAISDVVVVPSERDGGTNALLLSPPDLMQPHFGPGSLSAHMGTAEGLGLRCSLLPLPRIGLDIDTGEDVDALLARGLSASRTYEVCRALRPTPA
jgi:2-phospho-L-lactate guanylyltransferase